MNKLTEYGIIATFYQDGYLDCFTFVLDEKDPRRGYHTMLATSWDGQAFSQFTEGVYEPNGNNEHLGNPVCVIGETLVRRVIGRLE